MTIGKFFQFARTQGLQIASIDLNLLYAVSIVFILSAAFTLTTIYSTTLFLSFHPRAWLAYFLGLQALVSIILSFMLTPVLTKQIKKYSLLILLLMGLSCFLFIGLNHFTFKGNHFIISVLTGSMGAVLSVIGWNIIPFAFGIRDYKKVARYAGQFSIFGVILSSFIVPVLLTHFTLESLLLVAGLLIVSASIFIYALKLVRAPSEFKKIDINKQPLQYPLFQKILLFIVLLVLTQTLIDYVFKYELATHFTHNALGVFLGYYKAVINLLALIVGITTTRYFLKNYHLKGLLYITQVASLLGCILVLLFPSLWTIAILESVKTIFYYNYSVLAIEIILNILPYAIRVSGKIQSKTIATPLCAIIVYFLLILVKNYITSYELILFTAIAFLPTIYLVKKIIDQYQNLLQNEIEFRRFNFFSDKPIFNEMVFDDLAYTALQSHEKEMVLQGLDFVNKMEYDKIPSEFYFHLNHPDPLIRKALIRLIKYSGNEKMLRNLEVQFPIEKDPEIKFYLLDAILALNPYAALSLAKKYKADPYSDLYPAYIHVMLHCGDASEINASKKVLNELINSANPLSRREAAFIIGENNLKPYENDLRILIEDSDTEVSEAAIAAVAEMGMHTLTPDILEKISHGKVSISIKKTIVKLGAAAIPYILDKLSRGNNFRLLIKVLASIPGKKAESTFIELMKTKNIFHRTLLAKEMMYRACQLPISNQFKYEAKKLIFSESGHIEYLQHLLGEDQQASIAAEIYSRISMAKQRILYWLAIATDPIQINKLAPVLLKQTDQGSYLLVKEKALELLELYIKNKKLLNAILYFFDISADQKNNLYFSNSFSDLWLEKIITLQTHCQENEKMNLLKVLTLRQVDLFKDLPGEALLSIAEETQELSFKAGDIVFLENTLPDGLYIIASGKIKIIRQEKVLNSLGEHQYFGELALIDNSVRTASAIAETDCILLFLEKSTFDRITDDLPEVLRVVSQVILRYLRQNFAAS